MTDYLASLTEDAVAFQEQKVLIQGSFDTMLNTILSLFKSTTGGVDWDVNYRMIEEAGVVYSTGFLFFIVFVTIVVWNIVLSSFVEKAFKLAVPDWDTMLVEKRKAELKYVKQLEHLLTSQFDTSHGDYINLEEFKRFFHQPALKAFFHARDLDLKDAELFFQMLSAHEHSEEVSVHAFIQGCLRLRGLASNIDVQSLHFDMKNMHVQHMKNIKDIKHLLKQQSSRFSQQSSTTDLSMPHGMSSMSFTTPSAMGPRSRSQLTRHASVDEGTSTGLPQKTSSRSVQSSVGTLKKSSSVGTLKKSVTGLDDTELDVTVIEGDAEQSLKPTSNTMRL